MQGLTQIMVKNDLDLSSEMQQKNIDMQRAEVLQLNVQRVANYGKGEIITRGVFAEKPFPVIEHLELNRCFR